MHARRLRAPGAEEVYRDTPHEHAGERGQEEVEWTEDLMLHGSVARAYMAKSTAMASATPRCRPCQGDLTRPALRLPGVRFRRLSAGTGPDGIDASHGGIG
jgi:hypothetical protein